MSLDRGGRNDVRQRRAFQKLAYDPLGTLGLIAGNGIILNPGDNSISVDLATVNPGLIFTDGLTVDLRNTDPGLELTATGVGILLGSNPGLTTTGGLAIDLRDTDPGLERTATGVGVLLASNSGLSTTGGVKIVLSQSPSILTLGASGLGTQFVTVSGTAGNEALVSRCGTGGTNRMDHPGANGGQIHLASTGPVMRIGTSGAAFTITTSAVTMNCLGGASYIIYNSLTGSGTDQTAFELRVGSTKLQGFAGPITIQPRTPVAGGGPGIFITGGNATTSNTSGGAVTISGGFPKGSGQGFVLINVIDSGGVSRAAFKADVKSSGTQAQIGFYGAATIDQPGTYTITAAPAVATALDADANAGVAYVGIDNLQVGAVYATVADLNNARADIGSLSAVLRQLIKHLGDTTGLGLVNETAY